jgi:hypothetical protein
MTEAQIFEHTLRLKERMERFGLENRLPDIPPRLRDRFAVTAPIAFENSRQCLPETLQQQSEPCRTTLAVAPVTFEELIYIL